MPIKISVVIPTYRRPGLLVKCLNALVRQSLDKAEYEVIVISDGPDDLTAKAVQNHSEYNRVIRYMYLPQKKGPAAARNMGWQNAKGNLVAFTDDDCLPDENWLGAILNSYSGEEKMAYTGRVKVPLPPIPTDYELNTAHLETASFVTANCCCTRAALEAVIGFDERFSMAWREDSDLEFKLHLAGIPVVRLPDALIVHPVRKAAWGISIKEQKKGVYNALLYKKFPDLYRKNIQSKPQWDYYVMVTASGACIAAILASAKMLAITSFLCWTVLQLRFIYRRLARTSRSFRHVSEMVTTSLVIPFVSVYWHLYGAWRYRVLFL